MAQHGRRSGILWGMVLLAVIYSSLLFYLHTLTGTHTLDGSLGVLLGLSWLQNTGKIDEKTFQYIAIGVAVIVVVINGVMRRKVKP